MNQNNKSGCKIASSQTKLLYDLAYSAILETPRNGLKTDLGIVRTPLVMVLGKGADSLLSPQLGGAGAQVQKDRGGCVGSRSLAWRGPGRRDLRRSRQASFSRAVIEFGSRSCSASAMRPRPVAATSVAYVAAPPGRLHRRGLVSASSPSTSRVWSDRPKPREGEEPRGWSGHDAGREGASWE